jgi:iron complex outermembrane recepter protein
MYRVGLQWQPNSDVQIYGVASNGFRSGGYNVRTTSATAPHGPFDDERSTNFELGFKSDLFDRKLRLNGAFFFNKVKDMQRDFILADPIVGLVQVIQNSADADIYGFEIEAQARLTDNWIVGGNVGVLEGKYTRVIGDLNGDGAINVLDKNLKIPRLAPVTWGVFSVLDIPLANEGKFTLRANYQDRASAAYTDNNRTFLSPVQMLDGSVSYSLPGDRVKFTVFGRNLLNANYEGAKAPVLGGIRFLKEGRVIGGEVAFSF